MWPEMGSWWAKDFNLSIVVTATSITDANLEYLRQDGHEASFEAMTALQTRSPKIIKVWKDELWKTWQQGRVSKEAITKLAKAKFDLHMAVKANAALLAKGAENCKSVESLSF